MGLFFYTKKGSIISTVDLPTTEIIEPSFIFFSIWYNIVVATLSVMDITQDSGS